MRRRDVLRTLAGGASLALAGCLGGFGTQSAWRDPPLVEDRPDAVYVPAVTESMGMYGRTSAGPYGLALLYSYPHRFWNVTNRDREKVVVTNDDAVHLMVAVWDEASGRVLPTGSDVSVRVDRDGSTVTQEVLYPMLSQQMGFHYGDNFPLDGEGDYTARVTVGRPGVERTGAFERRLEGVHSGEFAFTFDTDQVYGLELDRTGDRAGERDAIPPMKMDVGMGGATGQHNGSNGSDADHGGMDHDGMDRDDGANGSAGTGMDGGHSMGVVPPVETLPGTHVGRTTTGDAVLDLLAVERDGGETLVVVARTPYNEFVLPSMSLSATVRRGGETAFDDRLVETLSPDLGSHYAAPVDALADGDEVTLRVAVPPQVARHDGYETAFFEMPERTVTVER
ncbi:iron transporter [Halomarina ordinaria]|uniref:Iron transporter n=1 Tax=Halomarina ordinaria TaxID=3033939 RepID=A0ABD5U3W9_9EURY|nr:iron transporter [Halomarina sp. PSRA2]